MGTITAADIQKFLGSIEPFKALPPQDLKALAAGAKPRTFAKGQAIYSEGESADGVWVLYKGRIQVFKATSEAKPFAIESLAPGELFGTLCRLGSNGRTYPCTAVATGPTEVLWIAERVFLDYYSRSSGFLRGVCALCSDRLQDVQGMRCIGQESVPVRMASMLCRLEQVHGPVIPFTKKELSELIGAALETTFRVLADMEQKGFLSSSRGKIHIKNLEGLKSFL